VHDGQRGYFFGLYSQLEDDNVCAVPDLAFEAEIMAEGANKCSSSRAPVKVVDFPITFDDGDMYIDFDA
jgi:hypothetical protein